MDLFTDAVTSAYERALSGVAQRQRVTANNIANVATPGFRSARVEFEDNLASAIQRGTPRNAVSELTAAGTPVREDGNDVALDSEIQIMIKSGLQYDALVQALNFKLGLLRSAIEGR